MSMSALRVGDIAAAPGEKKSGTLTVPGRHDPDYNPKIIIVNGAKTGQTQMKKRYSMRSGRMETRDSAGRYGR